MIQVAVVLQMNEGDIMKKPMAETYAQIKERKRLELIDNLILTAGAVFFCVVGAIGVAGYLS